MRPLGILPSRLAVSITELISIKRSYWLCVLLAALLLDPLMDSQDLDEPAIKVAYVFNLTKYVQWPRAGSQLVIGFIGDGPIGEALEKMLAGKTSDSRLIRVVLSPSEESLNQCDVIYVASSSTKRVHETLDHLRNKSVLTIGDTESFVKSGGMIGLVRVGQQVRMIINQDAAERARLKISSRVLNLATIVQDGPEARN